MTPAAAPYLAACVLLVAAGAAKVARPDAARRALAGVIGRSGRPVPAGVARAGGLAECGTGAVGLVAATPGPAAVVAVAYLAFAAFVALSRVRGAGAGCGCFGAASAGVRPGPLHVAVNLALSAAALSVVVAGGLTVTGPDRAVLTLGGAGLAWVVYLVLVPLPGLLQVVREPAP